MTLQASGAISLSDLRGEFGGSTPDSLSEYYRGGGLVPDTPTNASIPTSGAISLSNFYSTSAVSDHATTITIGTTSFQSGSYHDLFYTNFIPIIYNVYGYDGGLDYHGFGGFGSIGSATYSDAGGNSRTITSCYWVETTTLHYTLNGSSIPNTNTTFIGINVNGNSYARSSATYQSNTPSGASSWVWSAPGNPFGTSGTINFTVDVV